MASSVGSFQWVPYLFRHFPLGLEPAEITHLSQIIHHLRATLLQTDPAPCLIDKGSFIEEFESPRRLIVLRERSIVVLNRKGNVPPLRGGGEHPMLKWAYCPETAQLLLKKRIFSSEQKTLIQFLTENQLPGCADILFVGVHRGKMQYFSRFYPDGSLGSFFKEFKTLPSVDRSSLLALQNALKTLHETRFRPGAAISSQQTGHCYDLDAYGHHGDISPGNAVLEHQPNGQFALRWIDWGYALNRSALHKHTLGWGSPEAVLKTARLDPSQIDVSLTKKDAWGFALFLGSLLKGNFGSLKDAPTVPLPNFHFILSKLSVNPDGSIDELGLKDLTQNEIDTEILACLEDAPTEDKPFWQAIFRWLRLNPEERSNLATCYVDPSGDLITKAPLSTALTPQRKPRLALVPTTPSLANSLLSSFWGGAS